MHENQQPQRRRDLLQVRKARRADAGTVAHGAAVAGQVVTVNLRGSLVSDLIVYLGSIDFVMSDVDR
jgi:NADH:ubiquinone oxidoreductase subunit D